MEKIYQVDAFTDKPFSGNPAGVCILFKPQSESWMQAVAAEMNLSETAFLYKQGDIFNLRWFTPTVEVELCGHATLASAHILWESGFLSPQQIAKFQTRSGLLTAERKGQYIELNFPAMPAEPSDIPPGLSLALGVAPDYSGKNKFDYLLELQSEDIVRSMQPDFAKLEKLPVRGIIVTAQATSPEYDFVSRFFAPGAGINEDPVTGSAHCCLGPYWSKKLSKNEFTAYQASKRGGVIRVRVQGKRVYLSGKAVTVFKGEIVV